MSRLKIRTLALVVATAVSLAGPPVHTALAAPSAAQTAADRAAVEAAAARYEKELAKAGSLGARADAASVKLDAAVAAELEAREQLRARVVGMYRSGNADPLSLLLGASSFDDFVARWELLLRMALHDADNLRSLKAARAQAQRSAEELLILQAEQARTLDALAAEVERAKKELAASEAALREYQSRIAAARAAAEASAKAAARTSATQQLTGTGDWKSAVASHYGRDFTGTGASGAKIGPYSMIVAHKTLPFGTLIEFEYKGRCAVASVQDRGPYTPGRTFDLGPGVVRTLDFSGVHEVRYRIITR